MKGQKKLLAYASVAVIGIYFGGRGRKVETHKQPMLWNPEMYQVRDSEHSVSSLCSLGAHFFCAEKERFRVSERSMLALCKISCDT